MTNPPPTADLPTLLADLERRHQSPHEYPQVCWTCRQDWPCDAAQAHAWLERVTAERDALAAALGLRTHEFAAPANKPRVGTERCDGWACGREKDNPVHSTPPRVLAALDQSEPEETPHA